MSDINAAVDLVSSRRDIYDQAEAYYEGSQDEVFASQKIANLLSGALGEFRLNFISVPVNAVWDRLEVASITSEDPNSQDIIGETWEKNELMLDANEVHKWALVYGDAYMMAWPDPEGEYIELHYNGPKNVGVVYNSENPRQKELGVKMWRVVDEGSKKRHRLNLYYPDRIEKYISTGSGRKDWRPYEETIENPFGEIPIFHFRTSRPYGEPEHRNGYGAQDAINKLVATQMSTVDYQSAPQRYALSSGELSPEITDFEEGESDRENIGSLKHGPGELWYLKGVQQVGQFSPADPKVFLEPIDKYVKSMAVLTETPLVYFERTGHMPSGEALRVAEAPLVKKVKNRQVSFGSAWREVFRFVLRANGVDADVQVEWKDSDSVDRLTELEIVLKKIEAGIPAEQALAEAGYDTSLVKQWNANEGNEVEEE